MDQDAINKCAEGLSENFRTEIEIYTAILELTKKENETILSGMIDKTLEFVKQKQDLLLKIEAIEQSQTDLKKIWSECRHQVPEDKKKSIRSKLAVLGKLLEDLIHLEKKNEKILSESIVKAKSQSPQGSAPAKNVAQAYGEKTKENKEKGRDYRNN